jgi:DNA-directed RNA polymerase specialized sigma24 family protein
MSNKENQSKKETRRIYIRSQRRWQEVPEEYYREHVRFHDTYRHRQQDRGLCSCPRHRWWVCDTDCLTCEYRNADTIASLDMPIGDEDSGLILLDTLADDCKAVSELAVDRVVLRELFKRLAELMPEAKTIGSLRLDGFSDETIAKAIGIPRNTFRSRIKAAKKLLAQEYPDFFN